MGGNGGRRDCRVFQRGRRGPSPPFIRHDLCTPLILRQGRSAPAPRPHTLVILETCSSRRTPMRNACVSPFCVRHRKKAHFAIVLLPSHSPLRLQLLFYQQQNPSGDSSSPMYHLNSPKGYNHITGAPIIYSPSKYNQSTRQSIMTSAQPAPSPARPLPLPTVYRSGLTGRSTTAEVTVTP